MDALVQAKSPGIVRVLGGLQPLLATDKATVVEFRDGFGELMALFFRQSGDLWAFSTKSDEDWDSNLVRLGYAASSITAKELAKAFKPKGG